MPLTTCDSSKYIDEFQVPQNRKQTLGRPFGRTLFLSHTAEPNDGQGANILKWEGIRDVCVYITLGRGEIPLLRVFHRQYSLSIPRYVFYETKTSCR